MHISLKAELQALETVIGPTGSSSPQPNLTACDNPALEMWALSLKNAAVLGYPASDYCTGLTLPDKLRPGLLRESTESLTRQSAVH